MVGEMTPVLSNVSVNVCDSPIKPSFGPLMVITGTGAALATNGAMKLYDNDNTSVNRTKIVTFLANRYFDAGVNVWNIYSERRNNYIGLSMHTLLHDETKLNTSRELSICKLQTPVIRLMPAK